jgi:hypothetical protein
VIRELQILNLKFSVLALAFSFCNNPPTLVICPLLWYVPMTGKGHSIIKNVGKKWGIE